MPGEANRIQKGEVGSERLIPHWGHRKVTKSQGPGVLIPS